MRKLATIRKIQEIKPIPDADKIVAYRVDDWWVVDNVDQYVVGELVVYAEPDSWVPHHLKPELSKGKEPRIYNGVPGQKLRTIKLRGQLSQGLLLPLDPTCSMIESELFEGLDVSLPLNIQKWEAPVPQDIAGQVSGNFPTFIPKTDQERCQNLRYEIFEKNKDSQYEVTMKLDGTSFTAYYKDGTDAVCGRNWQLKINDENQNNALVRMYVDSGLQQALIRYGHNIAVQCELMGPKIQGNRENLSRYRLYVFDIYDIDNACYLGTSARHAVLDILYDFELQEDFVQHVPIFSNHVTLADLGITTVQELLDDADGPSIVHSIREGKVYKEVHGKFSFKAISNDFLIREK